MESQSAIRHPPSAIESWLPQLLQTNDSLFPSGTFAHSFGLEGIVQLGIVSDQRTLAAFLEGTIIPALQQLELPMIRFAYEAAAREDVRRIEELAERYGAMKGSYELRQASSRIGAQRLQMLRQLSPQALPRVPDLASRPERGSPESQPLGERSAPGSMGHFRTAEPAAGEDTRAPGAGSLAQADLLERLEEERAAGRFQPHAPVVFGVQLALRETPVEAALVGYYYQSLAALVSAAMKLIRLGPVGAQTLLADGLSQVGEVVSRAQAVPEEAMGWFSAALDIASARHETAYTRIFIS